MMWCHLAAISALVEHSCLPNLGMLQDSASSIDLLHVIRRGQLRSKRGTWHICRIQP